jgi:hypothetical protein
MSVTPRGLGRPSSVVAAPATSTTRQVGQSLRVASVGATLAAARQAMADGGFSNAARDSGATILGSAVAVTAARRHGRATQPGGAARCVSKDRP